MKRRITVIALNLCLILIITSCKTDSFEERKLAAKELLSKDCNFIVNASTEFIKEKHPIMGAIADAVISNRCDCLIDSLSVQFAKQYSLDEIQQMQTQPIETIETAVEYVVDKNSDVVKGCLF